MNLFGRPIISILLATLSLTAYPAIASSPEAALVEAATQFLPGTSGFGSVKVQEITVDKKTKTVTVFFNEATSYIPFTAATYKEFYNECTKAVMEPYKGYKLKLIAGDKNLEDLVLFAPKKNIGPKEKNGFIVRNDNPAAPDGLNGANIAIWQSHGWYFEPKLNRWEWQRARIFETVEDLYTQSYVMPFLMPMLENAGAYVMSPRERDVNINEIIIDNDGGVLAKGAYKESGIWNTSAVPGFAYTTKELRDTENPFKAGSSKIAEASTKNSAEWTAEIPEDGMYAVYVSYPSLPKSSTSARYTVTSAAGDEHFTVNQKMGGGTWIYLGHFPFKKGSEAKVTLSSNKGDKGLIGADAVKIGGGYGNVARRIKDSDYEYVTSNYPRFTEGARYFLQWAGAPDSVYTPSENVNDYTDDYRSRGLWVNWLTGGSSMLPKAEGLNIPVDLSFAFHTDAGTTQNDSIIGTLGIYCTVGEKLGNGSSRNASRDLTDLIMTELVNDARTNFEPNWTRRGMWDKSYFEARVPEVPAMLLEFLSHQNMADMTYGLDPAFRFMASRSIYKGMLKFIAQRDGREYVVQPLPVRCFAISEKAAGEYILSWAETVDSSEPTATPTYYLVQERIDDGAFRTISTTKETNLAINITDNNIHSYRIIAGNAGGRAFPSEVLALCYMPGSTQSVTIVNGFTRVSAPDTFDAGNIAGFYDAADHGVPYVQDISYIGAQFEFRREIPWMDDDAPGFGASRADYETKVIAGNTFDFVYTHGVAIRNAGASFVSSSVEAFMNSDLTPGNVDLILGKQKEIRHGRGYYGTYFKAFPLELQNKMTELAAKGTNFFVSGCYVASDLCANRYSDAETRDRDKKFAEEVLGFKWRTGQASITGGAYEIQTPFKSFGKETYTFNTELSEECYAVESPDSFYPSDREKGSSFMLYRENNIIAGTAMCDGSRKTVVIGFPFETINGQDKRDSLMKQILNFFNDPNDCKTTK